MNLVGHVIKSCKARRASQKYDHAQSTYAGELISVTVYYLYLRLIKATRSKLLT